MTTEDRPVSILMCTEGTYPFMGGGVSTWCHILCDRLADIHWHIFAVVADPYVEDRYNTASLPQIQSVIQVPLWGAEETGEYIETDLFARLYDKKQKTTEQAVSNRFVPYFVTLLEGLEDERLDMTRYGKAVLALYHYFQNYDYKATFRSRLTWQTFRDFYVARFESMDLPQSDRPSLFDLTVCLRWTYNMLMPLVRRIPETDIVHATIAASAALAGVISKLEYGSAFLLTDHGVYVRERYIAVSRADFPYFQKHFLINLAKFFTKLSYFYSDVVAPCAHFNARWELPWGCCLERDRDIRVASWPEPETGIVPDLKSFPFIEPTYKALSDMEFIQGYDEKTRFPWVRTVYNGVDTDKFVPGDKPEKLRPFKTGVALARIFPLKDILTMIRACAIVKEQIPNVRFIVYGSLKADPPYVKKCRDLIAELDIEESFLLPGYHSKPHQAVWEGDISLLSSISEGFPYTVLESMSCGVPVVGTDVGGVKEAIGTGPDACGVVVKPRDPQAFAEGCIQLLSDDALRAELGRKARQRILRLFQEETSVGGYRAIYERLAAIKRPLQKKGPSRRDQELNVA